MVVLTTVTAVTGLMAQDTGQGAIGGRVTTGGAALPGAQVVLGGPVQRQVTTDIDGRYAFTDLPAGSYTVTATLTGFETVVKHVPVTRVRVELNLIMTLPCVTENLDPPLRIPVVFDEMLNRVHAVAHVRIMNVSPPERGVTDWGCVLNRRYAATVLDTINVAGQGGGAATFTFFAAASEEPLETGDELFTFLFQDSQGQYFESNDEYRIPIRNGRVEWTRTDTTTVRTGDTAANALDAIRASKQW
jgi:hypothetical protein